MCRPRRCSDHGDPEACRGRRRGFPALVAERLTRDQSDAEDAKPILRMRLRPVPLMGLSWGVGNLGRSSQQVREETLR